MTKHHNPTRNNTNGQPHATICGAKTRTGKPCQQHPIKGGTRCRMHGGASKAARRTAAANVLEAKVRGELTRINIQPVTNPAQQLARIVGEQIAFLDLARAKLAEVTDTWTHTNPVTGADEVRATVTVYERAIGRTTNALDRMCRLGIQDRIAHSQELTAAANVTALLAMIDRARADHTIDGRQLILDALQEDQ
ncbi:hypothetical protein FYJ43_04425 [Cutibacterium sp. WCA-380-WT-3A]|uniref:Uncharacterized protein n=1 Tax=Cutibacterium porci TaxID=2605781 RepID=A0A7K0J5W3_9ACTN|nr:HGGxSTG domain-containing protein [Cutibacterium porci]MSS45303.1 hypothetical protein [Cutibacterium porci]